MKLVWCLAFILIIGFIEVLEAQKIEGILFREGSNEPIAYANVFERTSTHATLSDNAGHFDLNVLRSKPAELVFSCMGYQKSNLVLSAAHDTSIVIFLKENVHSLNEVQVMASPLRQILTRSYSVTVIDSATIEEKIATALIDVLEEVPGITKRSEYHSPIALRGLKGKRLLITKDGNRRMGNFPDGFMGQGINVYDLAKIEVIKGPASVKYGPGAIAGIINMESKSPFLQPGLHGRMGTSYGYNNQEKTVMSSLNWCNLDNAVSFSSRFRDASDFSYGNGKRAFNSAYRDKDIRLAYTFENNNALRLSAESELHLGGPWGRPLGFNGTEHLKVYNHTDNTWHSVLNGVWQPEQTLKRLDVSVYLDCETRDSYKDAYDIGSGRLSYRENVSYANHYSGWRALGLWKLSENTQLSAGTDGVYYRIQSPTILTDYFLTTVIHNKVTKNAGVSLGGLFAETEYKTPDNRFKLRGGIRADVSHINEGDVHDTTLTKGRNNWVYAWNGTASGVYSIRNQIFLSLQVARSCRMPDANEMFIVTSNTDGTIYGNSALDPEYGLNFDGGIRGNMGSLYFDCSLFSNFLHNFISLENWTNSGKKGINYTYYNVDRARIFGAELSLGAQWQHVLHPDNKLTYNGTYVYSQGDKLTNAPGWLSQGVPLRDIPPFNTRQELTLRRLLSSAFSAYLGVDMMWYAPQHRIAPSEDGGYVSPYYNLTGISSGCTWRRPLSKWDLKFRVDNLTNNYYFPFESIIPGMGRNWKVFITIAM